MRAGIEGGMMGMDMGTGLITEDTEEDVITTEANMEVSTAVFSLFNS